MISVKLPIPSSGAAQDQVATATVRGTSNIGEREIGEYSRTPLEARVVLSRSDEGRGAEASARRRSWHAAGRSSTRPRCRQAGRLSGRDPASPALIVEGDSAEGRPNSCSDTAQTAVCAARQDPQSEKAASTDALLKGDPRPNPRVGTGVRGARDKERKSANPRRCATTII